MNTDTNKSICRYPWNHSYIGSRYERKICCISADVEEASKTSTKDFWNSEIMKEVRRKMIAGEKVSHCEICYRNEDLGILSLRKESFIDYHPEEEVINSLVEQTNEDGSIESDPTYFDYRTIHCNLQCISCSDVYSSRHAVLQKEMHGTSESSFVIDSEFEESMAEEILQSLRSRKLTRLYWAGGEPMMSPLHWKVVEELEKVSMEDPDYVANLPVHYNTNLTRLIWKGKSIPEMLKFYQPRIQASLDGVYETFEYCRDGGKWSVVEENWKQYYKNLNERNHFGVASVLSAPVILDINRWFDFFEPYDPILYNHKLICDKQYKFTSYQGFLDINFFPKDIFDRVVDNALNRFDSCNLRYKEKSIEILLSQKYEKQSDSEFYDDIDNHKLLKQKTLQRDNFLITKRSFAELLKIIDKQSYEWYMDL